MSLTTQELFLIILIGRVKGCVRDAHCWPAQIRKFAGWRKSSAKNLECDRKKAWFNISVIINNYNLLLRISGFYLIVTF